MAVNEQASALKRVLFLAAGVVLTAVACGSPLPTAGPSASPSEPEYQVLHSFAGGTTDGAGPSSAGVVQGSDGALYGTTWAGGAFGLGTVFKVSADGSSFSLLHSFTRTDGYNPNAGLVQGTDGTFYGTALQGGLVNCHGLGCGTVFRISADGSSFSVLHKFAGGTSDGGAPNASLVQGTDGAFYGTTTQGGASDNGVVFRLSYRP